MSGQEVTYLGFGNLPNHIHRKYMKKGFELTIMVCGQSGLGKSTMVQCLFQSGVKLERKPLAVHQLLDTTTKIEKTTAEIEEGGVKIKLTVVDTPGFGASLNATEDVKPIVTYIEEQYEKYLEHESGVNRRHISDTRIHCCFYFISPESYHLQPLDVMAMKSLHNKVNLIPIIAKADFLIKTEVTTLKKRILADIKSHGIQIYTIPDYDPEEEEDYKERVRQLKASVPFAIASSLEVHEVKGRKVRGRSYPWGIVETENPEHSDLVKLRDMLVSHLQDLREVTHDVHYENFRAKRLMQRNNSDLSLKDNISIASEDRDRALQEKEEELRRMKDMIEKMQKEMAHNQKATQQSIAAEDPIKPNGSQL